MNEAGARGRWDLSGYPAEVRARALEMEREDGDAPPLEPFIPGTTSPEFGILDSPDLPGIVEVRVIAWHRSIRGRAQGGYIVEDAFFESGALRRERHEYPGDPEDPSIQDSRAELPGGNSEENSAKGQVVAPEFVPDDLSIPQRIFRLENLVREAGDLGWLGHETREKLRARAQAARRKAMLPGEAADHSHAAWAKMLQFRDDLKDAFEEWTDRRPYDSSGFPDYNLFVADAHEADDRGWYLLEPNARDLLDRLAPPGRRDSGSGPGRR